MVFTKEDRFYRLKLKFNGDEMEVMKLRPLKSTEYRKENRKRDEPKAAKVSCSSESSASITEDESDFVKVWEYGMNV